MNKNEDEDYNCIYNTPQVDIHVHTHVSTHVHTCKRTLKIAQRNLRISSTALSTNIKFYTSTKIDISDACRSKLSN